MAHYHGLKLEQQVEFSIHDFSHSGDGFPTAIGTIIAIKLVETADGYSNTVAVDVRDNETGKIYSRSWNGVLPIKK